MIRSAMARPSARGIKPCFRGSIASVRCGNIQSIYRFSRDQTPPKTKHVPFLSHAFHVLSASCVLWVAVYVACASFLVAEVALNFVDIDVWHQMNLIRASLAAGHLLTQDPFSYVPTVRPMIQHEWGSGVIAFFLSRWMGGSALLLLKFAAAIGTLTLAMLLAQNRGAHAATLCLFSPVAADLMQLGFLPAVRAQVYSFLFIVLLVWVLESSQRGWHRWSLLWLAIFPIWVNLHGGFVAGLCFVFLYALEQTLIGSSARATVLLLGAMGLEVLINPYGVRYFSYLFRAVTMARPRIPEWTPVWNLGWVTAALFLCALALWLYALVDLKIWRTHGIMLIPAAAIEAILHYKMLPLFAIVWLCYAPALFQQTKAGGWLQHFEQRRRRFLILACSAAISLCIISAVRQRFWQVEVPQVPGEVSYPVGAVNYLADHHFQGNIMAPFRKGAYVSWKLYPNVRVSIDSRYEVAYSEAWVERVFRFYEAREGWADTLAAYPTDVVLAPTSSPVLPQLRQVGWKAVYVDGQFELDARPGLQPPACDSTGQHFSGVFP